MENINLIRKIAWSFHRTTGVDYNELFSEACLAYWEAVVTFDSKKATLSTWAWINIRDNLITLIHKERNKPLVFSECSGKLKGLSYNQFKDSFEDFLTELPEDCQFIAQELLDNEEKYLGKTPNFRKTKNHTSPKKIMYETLRKQGWSWPRIWRNLRNMKVALKKSPQDCIIY